MDKERAAPHWTEIACSLGWYLVALCTWAPTARYLVTWYQLETYMWLGTLVAGLTAGLIIGTAAFYMSRWSVKKIGRTRKVA